MMFRHYREPGNGRMVTFQVGIWYWRERPLKGTLREKRATYGAGAAVVRGLAARGQ